MFGMCNPPPPPSPRPPGGYLQKFNDVTVRVGAKIMAQDGRETKVNATPENLEFAPERSFWNTCTRVVLRVIEAASVVRHMATSSLYLLVFLSESDNPAEVVYGHLTFSSHRQLMHPAGGPGVQGPR